MSRLMPDDEPVLDSPLQAELRAQASTVEGNAEIPASLLERHLERAVDRIKPGKAPGWDNIPGLPVKMSGPTLGVTYLELFNDCSAAGYFPTIWKKGLWLLSLSLLTKTYRTPWLSGH